VKCVLYSTTVQWQYRLLVEVVVYRLFSSDHADRAGAAVEVQSFVPAKIEIL
jgi:hypothetical protein